VIETPGHAGRFLLHPNCRIYGVQCLKHTHMRCSPDPDPAGESQAGRVRDVLGHKVHWSLPDYLQRSARHIASKTDFEQALAVGRKAVEFALAGMNSVMPVIVRTSDSPYHWTLEAAPLSKIANHEKTMPAGFIRKDGFGITAAARRYLQPLIAGEAFPPYGPDGLPAYVTLKLNTAHRELVWNEP
jgi:hypothetical protein